MNFFSTIAVPLVAAGLASALLAGCASAPIETGAAAAYAPAAGSEAKLQPANYALSPEEQEFDCKRLAGKVQIRILELRSRLSEQETSALSRTLQSASASVGGASSVGIDPASERARDLAMVQTFNRQLVDKNCRSFNLAKALGGTEPAPTPDVEPGDARISSSGR